MKTFPQRFHTRLAITIVATLAIVVGIYGRVAHLERHLFWQDEAYTALRVSGHHEPAFDALFDGRIHSASEVLAFQRRDPSTNVASVVHSLAMEDPHHGPFFYVLDRIAIDWSGSSIASYRSLSVLAGIAAIGCAFWLGFELFQSAAGGGTLAGLVAVSPLHVLYSRQAREYAVFSCIVFLSTTLLLRALRTRTTRDWIWYGFAITTGLYTDPIFTLVIAAQAIAAFILCAGNLGALRPFAVSAIGGGVAFSPWAYNAVVSHGNIQDQLSWGATTYPLRFMLAKWSFNVGAVFFDSEFAKAWLTPIAALCALTAAASIILVAWGKTVRTRTVAAPLIVLPIAVFVGKDLVTGSHFSTIARYLMPGWIGVEIAVAGALVFLLSCRPRIALSVFTFLILAGSFSAIYDNGMENWWDNNDNIAFQAVGKRIDSSPAPLIVSEAHWHVPLVLSRYVDPCDDFLLFRGDVPEIPSGRTTYLVMPSARTVAAISKRNPDGNAVQNVSPGVTTAITDFHVRLRNATRGKVNGGGMTADNALWLVIQPPPGGKPRRCEPIAADYEAGAG